MARTSMAMLLASLRSATTGGRCGRRRGGDTGGLLVRDLARVTAEQPGRRELAELVPDHVLGHVHGNELVAVVHRERVPDEIRDHRARARPRLHDALLVARVHRANLLHEAVVNVGTFMYASRHYRVALFIAWPCHVSAHERSGVATPSSCAGSSRLPSCPTGSRHSGHHAYDHRAGDRAGS